MAMDAQDKSQLTTFTQMAQKIIYDTERMRKFMQMLGSKDGALVAVQTVIGVIDKARPIPPQLAPLLGMNIYMIMVAMAQDITGKKADSKIMREVVNSILTTTVKSHQAKPPVQPVPQAPQAPQQAAAPMGLMQQGA